MAIRYNLGSTEQHTVYKAELVGILLVLHLADGRRKLRHLTIFTDNHTAIKVLWIETAGSQSYLMEALHKACTWFRKKHKGVKIEI